MDDALAAVFESLCTRLVRAGADKRAAWRLVTLATVSKAGHPQARTVVLRAVNCDPLEIVFYSDARTPKVAEIQADPRVSALFWDKGASLQLRVDGEAEVLTDGPTVDAARRRLAGYPGSDYARWAVPGEPIADPAAAETLSEDPLEYFALIRMIAHRLDWLELGRDGHRRAEFDCKGGEAPGWQGRWTVP
ncbi:MAG: pyridoxamine 5'-phosphate oxidase family protein [Pseudomonadota bacterium]